MFTSYNYRFCVKLSLRIMKEQREELCRKSKTPANGVMIYMGLHEMNPQIRKLRFQYSVIDWFDSHWENLRLLLERHPEYTNDQKKEITIFFAEYFAKLLDKVEVKGVLAKLGIPDLLTIQRKILSDLISTGEGWEENSRLLKLQMKKHEEEYRKLISEYETASEGKE